MSQSERHAPGHALVVGGGTMGVGIIAMFLGGGWKVDVVSRSASTRDALPEACRRALVALSKNRPAGLNYASAGAGSITNLAAVMFGLATGASTLETRRTAPASRCASARKPSCFNSKM